MENKLKESQWKPSEKEKPDTLEMKLPEATAESTKLPETASKEKQCAADKVRDLKLGASYKQEIEEVLSSMHA